MARRVLAVFLLVAAVPVAITAVAAYLAVDDVAAREGQRSARATARAGGQQVLSRLQAVQQLLNDWHGEDPDEALSHHPASRERLFRAVVALDPQGAVVSSVGPGAAELPLLWAGAAAQARARPSAADGPMLRTATGSDGEARVLMAQGDAERPRWIVALAPRYIWDAMDDAQADVQWEMIDAQGRLLFRSPAIESQDGVRSEAWPIFLGAGFASADWTLHYRYRMAAPMLHGSSFSRWIVSAAAITLLAAIVLAFGNIQRTMGPLEQLEQGTRALARRDYAARIRVQSNDEFRDLAEAFNAMAERIDMQFRAMAHAGAIDRAVLAGAHPSHAGDSVLACLQAVAPGCDVAFLVALDDRVDVRWRCMGEAEIGQAQLPAAAACSDMAFARDEELWIDGAAAPWAAPLPFGATRLLMLPIAQAGQCCGALLLRPASDAQALAEALPLLRDLRDRVAVGLSAAERRQELEHRAIRDSLTGLANRRGLIDHLEGREAAGPTDPYAVLFVDLDGFKSVNDTLGHDVGDDVLVEAARRMARQLPSGALLARQGGDEFVAVADVDSAAAAMALADRVVASLSAAFVRGPQSFALGASIGVAVAPAHGHGHNELLRRADLAMYAAKQAGRGIARLYDASLDTAALERVQMLSDLHAAIERDEFLVEYQPRIEVATGAIVSAEALVRWRHPVLGVLLPWRFIPLAEETGLIEAIDAIVMRRACRQWRAWSDAGILLHRLSVNVSARALGRGLLMGRVRDALAASGMPAAALELEITETVLAEGGQAVVDELNELRALGVTLALDDFGTGYSAMAMLRRLPMDVIKIDRAFVKDLEADPVAKAVVGAIMGLGGALKLRTVAEGVETPEQRRLLESLQVDELQGYLFARPCTVEAFEALPALQREGADAPG